MHVKYKCEVLEPLDNRLRTQSKTQCTLKIYFFIDTWQIWSFLITWHEHKWWCTLANFACFHNTTHPSGIIKRCIGMQLHGSKFYIFKLIGGFWTIAKNDQNFEKVFSHSFSHIISRMIFVQDFTTCKRSC
jgi:hypothetical protein